MSTRSNIKIIRKDGTETGIYCHSEGYIEGVGVTLQLAYNTAEKVEKLLALGDLSQIGYYTEPKSREHNFENREPNVCVAYHRDRGYEFYQSQGKQEFNYIFDEETAVWYVEKECYIDEGEKWLKLLDLDCYIRYEKRLLITALSECNFAQLWQDDEFANKDEVFDVCLKKAREARSEIVRKQQELESSYYMAYCD